MWITVAVQYTTGLTYKSLFSKNGYYLLSIGKTTSNWVVDVYDLNDGLKDTYFSRDNIESDNFIKGDVVYKFSPNLEFSAGINTKYGEYNMQEVIDPDTVYFYTYPDLELGDLLLHIIIIWLKNNPEYIYDFLILQLEIQQLIKELPLIILADYGNMLPTVRLN